MTFLSLITWFFGIGFLLIAYFVVKVFLLPEIPFSKGAKVIDSIKSNQYYIRNHKVIFSQNGNFFSLGSQELKDANGESFSVLADNIARDESHLYYNGELLENIDPDKAELLAPSKHENRISYFYIKDAKSVYFNGKKIPHADAMSFHYIDGLYSYDKNHFYYLEKVFADFLINFKSLEDSDYLMIEDSVYYRGEQKSF